MLLIIIIIINAITHVYLYRYYRLPYSVAMSLSLTTILLLLSPSSPPPSLFPHLPVTVASHDSFVPFPPLSGCYGIPQDSYVWPCTVISRDGALTASRR